MQGGSACCCTGKLSDSISFDMTEYQLIPSKRCKCLISSFNHPVELDRSWALVRWRSACGGGGGGLIEFITMQNRRGGAAWRERRSSKARSILGRIHTGGAGYIALHNFYIGLQEYEDRRRGCSEMPLRRIVFVNMWSEGLATRIVP